MKNDSEFEDMLELADLLELNEEERREVQLPTKIENKKCLNCGKPINGLPYNPKYCSARCGTQFRDAKRKFFTEKNRGYGQMMINNYKGGVEKMENQSKDIIDMMPNDKSFIAGTENTCRRCKKVGVKAELREILREEVMLCQECFDVLSGGFDAI